MEVAFALTLIYLYTCLLRIKSTEGSALLLTGQITCCDVPFLDSQLLMNMLVNNLESRSKDLHVYRSQPSMSEPFLQS